VILEPKAMACSVTRWVYDGIVSVLQYPKDSGIGLAAFRPSFREADATSIERRPSLRKRKTVSELHAEFTAYASGSPGKQVSTLHMSVV
jgi:hypothetical protein